MLGCCISSGDNLPAAEAWALPVTQGIQLGSGRWRRAFGPIPMPAEKTSLLQGIMDILQAEPVQRGWIITLRPA
jgi:hypothetical protein